MSLRQASAISLAVWFRAVNREATKASVSRIRIVVVCLKYANRGRSLYLPGLSILKALDYSSSGIAAKAVLIVVQGAFETY